MSRLTKTLSFITAGVLSLSMVLPCAAVYERDITTDPLFVYGDINFDGKCNSHDVVRIMKYIADAGHGTAYYADLNSDMAVNSKDLVRLMKLISGTAQAPEIENPFAAFADKNLMNGIPDTISGDAVTEEESAQIIAKANQELSEAVSVSLKLEFMLTALEQGEEASLNGYLTLAANRDENGKAEEAEIYVYMIDPSDSSSEFLISIILRGGYLYITYTDSTTNDTECINKAYLDRVLSMRDSAELDKLAEYFTLSVYAFENSGYGAVYRANIEKINSAILQYIADNSGNSDSAEILAEMFKLSGFEFSAVISEEGEYIGGFSNGGYEISIDNGFTNNKVIVSSSAKFVLNTSDEKITLGPSYNIYNAFSYDWLMLDTEVNALYDQNGDPVENYSELYAELCEVYGKDNVDEELKFVKYRVLRIKVMSLFDEQYRPVENYDELYFELCLIYGQEETDDAIDSYKWWSLEDRIKMLFDANYDPVSNYNELYAELCDEYGKCNIDNEIELYKMMSLYERVKALFDKDGIPVPNYSELYAELCEDYDQERVDSRIESYLWGIVYDKAWQLFDNAGNPVENYDELYNELCLVYDRSTVDDCISSIQGNWCYNS